MAEEEQVPDLYADSINISAGPFGFTLTLMLSEPTIEGDAGMRMIGRVRVSPELGRAMAETLADAHAVYQQEMAKGKSDGSRGLPARSRKPNRTTRK